MIQCASSLEVDAHAVGLPRIRASRLHPAECTWPVRCRVSTLWHRPRAEARSPTLDQFLLVTGIQRGSHRRTTTPRPLPPAFCAPDRTPPPHSLHRCQPAQRNPVPLHTPGSRSPRLTALNGEGDGLFGSQPRLIKLKAMPHLAGPLLQRLQACRRVSGCPGVQRRHGDGGAEHRLRFTSWAPAVARLRAHRVQASAQVGPGIND